jgi:hypothetical protein
VAPVTVSLVGGACSTGRAAELPGRALAVAAAAVVVVGQRVDAGAAAGEARGAGAAVYASRCRRRRRCCRRRRCRVCRPAPAGMVLLRVERVPQYETPVSSLQVLGGWWCAPRERWSSTTCPRSRRRRWRHRRAPRWCRGRSPRPVAVVSAARAAGRRGAGAGARGGARGGLLGGGRGDARGGAVARGEVLEVDVPRRPCRSPRARGSTCPRARRAAICDWRPPVARARAVQAVVVVAGDLPPVVRLARFVPVERLQEERGVPGGAEGVGVDELGLREREAVEHVVAGGAAARAVGVVAARWRCRR